MKQQRCIKINQWQKFWLGTLVFALCCAKPAGAARYRFRFFGDSLTIGFLANTSLLEEIKARELRPIKRALISYHVAKWWNPGEPHHQLDKFNHPDLAWPFFFSQSVAEADHEVEVKNYALSSARTKDLPEQIQTAKNEKNGGVGKQVVFFWMGHNDLFLNLKNLETIADQYRKEMKAALTLWANGEKGAIVVLLPLIDITQVYAEVDKVVWGEKRGLLGKKHDLKCKDTWKKYLPYWAFFPKGGNSKFEEVVRPKVQAMNAVLEELAKELTPKALGPDDNVYLSPADLFKDQDFRPEFLAEDCLHASEKGQKKIAEKVRDRLKREKELADM
jgi:lysophospholipase L1-like esterase